MTPEQITALEPAWRSYAQSFNLCIPCAPTREHLTAYCRGLMSDLPRKSVEPIALAAGTAVRTLQEFLTQHAWDHARLRDQLQRRVVEQHMPAPGELRHGAGTIGIFDETGCPKKGDKTPGVQHQYCGHTGKLDNCIVTVHLSYFYEDFMTLLDEDLFLPEAWNNDRARCRTAHIPDDIVYRPKWKIALEQYDRARANGLLLDWVTFDEGYGSKPDFLIGLESRGQHFVGEVPCHFYAWATRPKYHSTQTAFAARRADNLVRFSPTFRDRKWHTFRVLRKTLPPLTWRVKGTQVYVSRQGRPTDRTYWLIVAECLQSGETKYFISNAPPKTALKVLVRIAFTRATIEHVFRVLKTEIGFDHFEGRHYQGLMRHMILCHLVMMFIAEHTGRLRGEKSRSHSRAGGPCPQLPVSALA
jgi:SRSO17 transposase